MRNPKAIGVGCASVLERFASRTLGRMNDLVSKLARCAIYTRKSTEYNLELAFNSLDAQREACEAYIRSQAHEGWRLIPGRYDDGAFSGASLERPALQQLLADVRAGTIDIVLVYKVDRLTRSLADFAKLIELFDAHGVSFVMPRGRGGNYFAAYQRWPKAKITLRQGARVVLASIADWEPEALLEGVLMTDEQRCLCRQVRRLDWLKAWIGHCELMVGQAQMDVMVAAGSAGGRLRP
jgi:Resolvase, N terminal domain